MKKLWLYIRKIARADTEGGVKRVRYDCKPAPLDKVAKLITFSTLLIVGVLTWLTLVDKALYVLLVWIPLLGVLLYVPRGYGITEQNILIKRLLCDITITGAEVKSAEIVEKPDVGLRIWGSGGFFGYLGIFMLGDSYARLYCTRLKNIVLIKTSKRNYLISPDDPREFLAKWQSVQGNNTEK